MPQSNRPPEHARHVINRLFRGIPFPRPVYRQLIQLVNSLEAGKSELRGHLAERTAIIGNLTRELVQARELQSEEGLIGLYQAGTTLISKQAEEIKALKSELQRGKNEHDRLAQKLVEKGDQISKAENEKENCREAVRRLELRLEGLKSGSPDAPANTNLEFRKLVQRLEDQRKMAEAQQKRIKQLAQENDKLVMALGRQHFNELDLP